MGNELTFIDTPTRGCLTAREVNYWKLNLARVLKIGAEFEFNLPDKNTGTCKGKSFTCTCVNFKDDTVCWTKCLRESVCRETPDITRCENFDVETCDKTKCVGCDKYTFNCHGIQCSNHISACATCQEFALNCEDCAHRFDPKKNPESIRKACINEFNPSGRYGKHVPSGVHNVVTDGSLLGGKGMEVITTGRRVDYWQFFEMTQKIINTAVSRGAYINERCSIHFHCLASYYGKVPGLDTSSANNIDELEKPVPEIILANFHQLIRRFENALIWMSIGLDDPAHITRWERFRVSIFDHSAIVNSMHKVQRQVIDAAGGNKYSLMNYKFCDFDDAGQIKRLHVELRVMDGLLSPSAVSAYACLYYALFLKAVELSRYGVMQAGDAEWKKQTKIIKKSLMNNKASWDDSKKVGRFSNTADLHKYTTTLIAESYEMISFVKHILATIGPAYDVLEKLAEAPCGIRRCAGKSWEEIEADLAVVLTEEDVLGYEIKRIVDTRAITGVKSIQEWMKAASGLLKDNKNLPSAQESIEELNDLVEIHVEGKRMNGEFIWAEKIGSIMAIQ